MFSNRIHYKGFALLILYLFTLVQQLAFSPSERLYSQILSKDEQTFVVHQSIQKQEILLQKADYKPVFISDNQECPIVKWHNKSVSLWVANWQTHQNVLKFLELQKIFPVFSKVDIVFPFHDFV